MRKAKHVIILTNGMIMVFDEEGEQINDYQGFILEEANKLPEICDKDTKFSIGAPGIGEIDCDFAWWFINPRGQPPGM